MKRLIIYGFKQEEVNKMQNLIKFVNSTMEYISVLNEDFNKTLGEVILNEKFKIEDEYILNEKIVIFQNITGKELDVYLKILKTKLNKGIIFATVTPNSTNMKICELFEEFKMEREYFKKNKQ